jgi:hypothetical protein
MSKIVLRIAGCICFTAGRRLGLRFAQAIPRPGAYRPWDTVLRLKQGGRYGPNLTRYSSSPAGAGERPGKHLVALTLLLASRGSNWGSHHAAFIQEQAYACRRGRPRQGEPRLARRTTARPTNYGSPDEQRLVRTPGKAGRPVLSSFVYLMRLCG